ncbi:hypothetical protein TH66_21815 [Carbonactinospora thermoautotrophica]|uniref:DUF6980 domain-containing protein n=3 Tax=Carbonactinospora thermoautotrophica TaxID=1469144 RepID=A0A132NCA1_9ACTN|nr:hypothetical protein [Carbonactinospora thermoautotrophica]KWW97981.1 hypothetical protein TH66_21815 [Carbonactinospora thermoautotrophica]KWX07738.1 hypothetical protein TR74_17805 [Carbonactinospora thermoautotrophica]
MEMDPGDHCCSQMAYAVSEDDLPVRYKPKTREWGIDYLGGPSYYLLEYCPWCGKKLPSDLTEEWYRRVEQLGHEDPWLVEDEDLPEALRSDRWWKEAGL